MAAGTLFISFANLLSMQRINKTMQTFDKPPRVVDFLELKQLLSGLSDNPALKICFRYRLSGHMWYPHFTKVIAVTDNGGVTLSDSSSGKILNIPNIMEVIQFEIDDRFQNYQPNNHYNVRAFSVTRESTSAKN